MYTKVITWRYNASMRNDLDSQYCGEPPWPRGSVLGFRKSWMLSRFIVWYQIWSLISRLHILLPCLIDPFIRVPFNLHIKYSFTIGLIEACEGKVPCPRTQTSKLIFQRSNKQKHTYMYSLTFSAQLVSRLQQIQDRYRPFFYNVNITNRNICLMKVIKNRPKLQYLLTCNYQGCIYMDMDTRITI